MPKVLWSSSERLRSICLIESIPTNGGKADFFIDLGFSVEDWENLAEALRSLAGNYPVIQSMESSHGKKYIVDGEIATPIGKKPVVRTVWIVDRGQTIARLVTAYPHEKLL